MDIERTTKKSLEISMIPLVDIMLVLIIYFLVGGTVEQMDILKVTPPVATTGEALSQGTLVIVLGKHQEVLVNDELLSVEDIKPAVIKALANNSKKMITIKADASMDATDLIRVMNDVRAAGGDQITLATQAPWMKTMDFILYPTYLNKLEELQRFERRVTTPPFLVMLMVAFSCHLIVILVTPLLSDDPIITVPVKEVAFQLGDAEALSEVINKDVKSDRVLATLKALTQSTQTKPSLQSQSTPKPMKKTGAKGVTLRHKPSVPSTRHVTSAPRLSYSRATTNAATVSSFLTKGGLSASETQAVMLRYEQTLSQWINRYKVYPQEAKAKGQHGKVLLRIRIDRSGYIKFILIQQSSGHELLDQAVIQATRKANPVPIVPSDYPGGQLLEFLIPIRFTLK